MLTQVIAASLCIDDVSDAVCVNKQVSFAPINMPITR